MQITLDFTNCLENSVGNKGFSQDIILEWMQSATKNFSALKAIFPKGTISFIDLPEKGNELEQIMIYKDKIKGQFKNIVVLGIGGSALGSLTLQAALNHPSWNLLTQESRDNDPRYFLIDNTDPELIGTVLDVCEPSETLFIVISKSGYTPETIAVFNFMLKFVESNVGASWKKHFAVITDSVTGWLRSFSKAHKLQCFSVPVGVGGRFSVLSPVGLLPAALCGIDVQAVLEGAKRASEICFKPEFPQNWAYLFAVLHYLFMTQRNKNISVLMPYSNALTALSLWFKQLWAESLGKEKDNSGNIVNTGQTPVSAIGATDQHSQLQLFLEGPEDKLITFIEVVKFRRDFVIPDSPEPQTAKLSYLYNRTFSEVIQAELFGTRQALKEKGRPNLSLIIPALSPDVLGELLFGLEFATAMTGILLNIDPLNQPAVELGKIITQQILSPRM